MPYFSPTKSSLSPTTRLIITGKSELATEDVSVYGKRCWFSKFLHRKRYDNKRLVNILTACVHETIVKNDPLKMKRLENNLKIALFQIKQDNASVLQRSCFKRLFYRQHYVDLKNLNSALKNLQVKSIAHTISELKQKYVDLVKQDKIIKKISLTSSKDFKYLIKQAKELKKAFAHLDSWKAHASKGIQELRKKFAILLTNLNGAIGKVDNEIMDKCKEVLAAHLPQAPDLSQVKKYLEDWHEGASLMSAQLHSLSFPSLHNLSSPIVIEGLIAECNLASKKVKKKPEIDVTKKIEEIVLKLKATSTNSIFDAHYVNKAYDAFKEAKGKLNDLLNSVNNATAKNKVKKKIDKISDRHSQFIHNEVLASKYLSSVRNNSLKNNTIENYLTNLTLYKSALSDLAALKTSTKGIDLLSEPLEKLRKQLENERLKVQVEFEKHSKLIIEKMNADYEKYNQSLDSITTDITPKTIVNKLKACISFTTEYKSIFYPEYESQRPECQKIQDHLETLMQALALSCECKIEKIIDSIEKIDLNTVPIDDLKPIGNNLGLIKLDIDSLVLQKQIAQLIEKVSQADSQNQIKIYNERMIKTRELLDSIRVQAEQLDETSDVEKFEQDAILQLIKWQRDNQNILNFLSNHGNKSSHSAEVESILATIKQSYEYYKKLVCDVQNDKNKFAEIKTKTPSEQLSALLSYTPSISPLPTNVLYQGKLLLPFIEAYRIKATQEIEELNKERKALLETLQAVGSWGWEEAFAEYAPKDTIFDIIEEEFDLFNKLIELKDLVALLNESIKNTTLKPLTIKNGTVDPIKVMRKIFKGISLLTVADYQTKQIFSIEDLKEYLKNNPSEWYDRLRKCTFFEQ